MTKPTLGIIGTGKMGLPIATNLLHNGYNVVAFNRSTESLETLSGIGATRANSIADVAADADIILTSLTNQQSVRDVYLEPGGLAEHAREGQIYIETSTNDIPLIQEIGTRLEARGASLLDSPVSGGVPGAEAGSLTVMVGGNENVYKAALPVLKILGSNIHHLGPIGAGTAMKLVNQLLVGVNMAAVAEALVFGASAGASPDKILDVISTSFGGSKMLDRGIPLIQERNFAPATPVDLIRKDLGIVTESADQKNLTLNITKEALALFNRAHEAGLGNNDMTSIVIPLEEDGDLSVS